jgi:pyrophosphatase PpaX
MNFSTIAFDLDGTLIDSKPSIVFGVQELLRHYGLPSADPTEVRQLIGRPLPDIFTHVGLGINDYEHKRRIYSEFMFTHMEKNLRAFPGVVEGLSQLREGNRPIALVTSRGKDSIARCLEISGLCIVREDTTEHKPSPAPLLLAMQRLRCAPHQMVYVGDADVDLECARNAGCAAIYATYDADHKITCNEPHIRGIAESFHDVLRLLEVK